MAEGLLVDHESDLSVASELTQARVTEALKVGAETYEGELEMSLFIETLPNGISPRLRVAFRCYAHKRPASTGSCSAGLKHGSHRRQAVSGTVPFCAKRTSGKTPNLVRRRLRTMLKAIE